MRSSLVALAGLLSSGLLLFATGAAQAKVEITVDKNAQMMTVAVDGVLGLPQHHWHRGCHGFYDHHNRFHCYR